jgi:hypothetical protein
MQLFIVVLDALAKVAPGGIHLEEATEILDLEGVLTKADLFQSFSLPFVCPVGKDKAKTLVQGDGRLWSLHDNEIAKVYFTFSPQRPASLKAKTV